MSILFFFLFRALYARWGWYIYTLPFSEIIILILFAFYIVLIIRIIKKDISLLGKIFRIIGLSIPLFFILFIPFTIGLKIDKLISSGYKLVSCIEDYKIENKNYPKNINELDCDNMADIMDNVWYKYHPKDSIDKPGLPYIHFETYSLVLNSAIISPTALYYDPKDSTFSWELY